MYLFKDEALVRAVLEDYRRAPIDERLRQTLGFVEKLAATPGEVTADDILQLRRAGVSDNAIRDAIYVCFCFSILTRLADALDFAVNDARGQKWVGRILGHAGYGAGTLPG